MKVKSLNIKLLAQLFLTFLKIGPVTFGGGYAMIPLIEKEVVEKRNWVKTKDVTDIFALAESVPGAIAINSATFIGYRVAGVAGAIVAMAGILLPTFFIVVLLSIFFLKVQDNPKVEAAFEAIRATIVALITYAAIKIGKTAVIDKTAIVLIAVTVAVMYFFHIHPVLLIMGGGLAGIGIIGMKKKLGMKVKIDKEEKVKINNKDYYMGAGI
ncbi:chromate transporter [Alkalihalobacillus deserti]|uniref:chromate transporter n=1 Tax=Alkalihalobacillus deserti TaxID=2879466 RepID=UPI001D140518|nr:chromate transporter [Alkalihalobacillus deserti]